jgi:hypothetical protein
MTEIGSSGKKRKLPNAGEKQKETPKVNKQPQLFGPTEEGDFQQSILINFQSLAGVTKVKLQM